MNKEELSNWLVNKFKSCYLIVHNAYPDSIFWCYDENFVRKIKLCKLNNKDIYLPTKINGTCLFLLNLQKKYLWCDYIEIWKFFENNYTTDFGKIKLLLTEIINDNKLNNNEIEFKTILPNLTITDNIKFKGYIIHIYSSNLNSSNLNLNKSFYNNAIFYNKI